LLAQALAQTLAKALGRESRESRAARERIDLTRERANRRTQEESRCATAKPHCWARSSSPSRVTCSFPRKPFLRACPRPVPRRVKRVLGRRRRGSLSHEHRVMAVPSLAEARAGEAEMNAK
jgi:hypothetical protein